MPLAHHDGKVRPGHRIDTAGENGFAFAKTQALICIVQSDEGRETCCIDRQARAAEIEGVREAV